MDTCSTPSITYEMVLSAAYMGMGYTSASTKHTLPIVNSLAEHGWGQLEAISYLTEWAVRLESLYMGMDDGLKEAAPGVWAYEVAEPFGEWYGECISQGHVPNHKEMDESLLDIVAGFFTQCDANLKQENKARLLVALRKLLESIK